MASKANKTKSKKALKASKTKSEKTSKASEAKTEPESEKTSKVSQTKSDKILEEIGKRKSQQEIVDVDEERVKLVVFKLLDGFYAFYGVDVKEILPVGKIQYVPGSPTFILGVINVRGDIESVLDTNSFLGLPDQTQSNQNRIIIAAKDGMRSGLMAGSVEDVLDIPVSAVKKPISTLNDNIKNFVAGETDYNGNNVTLLDVGKIFKKVTVR